MIHEEAVTRAGEAGTTAKNAMTREVNGIQSTDTILRAARMMWDRDLRALPVFQARDPVGMLTDRDIVLRTVAIPMDPAVATVQEVMTKEAISCDEKDSIEHAARLMEVHNVRRLLVRNGNGEVSGVLTLGDVAKRLRRRSAAELFKEVEGHGEHGASGESAEKAGHQ